MFGLVVAIHVIVCALLIAIILIQAGRGGGLVESLSSVESMFGTRTNTFLTRATAILSTIFFITCVGLAFLSLQKSRSLMKDIKPKAASQETLPPGEAKKESAPEQPKSQSVKPEVSEVESTPNASGPKANGEVPKTE